MATLGDLCGLLCRAGCSIGAAAATLAFHPPEPSYAVGRHPSGGLVWALSERLAKVSAPLTEVDVIRSRSGSRIPIFVVRYPGASLTLLFAHGNATDCGLARAGLIDLCVNLRCNVAAYEYSGYGAATGSPTESSICRDAESAYEWLLERPFVASPRQIVLYGQSVGTGPTCYLASRHPVRGVVLHSPLLSGMRLLTDNRLLGCFDIFPNIDWIEDIRCPVFILHGLADEVIPVAHGQRLAAALHPEARGSVEPWFVEDGDHNNLAERFRDQYFWHLRRFLASLTPTDLPYEVDPVIHPDHIGLPLPSPPPRPPGRVPPPMARAAATADGGSSPASAASRSKPSRASTPGSGAKSPDAPRERPRRSAADDDERSRGGSTRNPVFVAASASATATASATASVTVTASSTDAASSVSPGSDTSPPVALTRIPIPPLLRPASACRSCCRGAALCASEAEYEDGTVRWAPTPSWMAWQRFGRVDPRSLAEVGLVAPLFSPPHTPRSSSSPATSVSLASSSSSTSAASTGSSGASVRNAGGGGGGGGGGSGSGSGGTLGGDASARSAKPRTGTPSLSVLVASGMKTYSDVSAAAPGLPATGAAGAAGAAGALALSDGGLTSPDSPRASTGASVASSTRVRGRAPSSTPGGGGGVLAGVGGGVTEGAGSVGPSESTGRRTPARRGTDASVGGGSDLGSGGPNSGPFGDFSPSASPSVRSARGTGPASEPLISGSAAVAALAVASMNASSPGSMTSSSRRTSRSVGGPEAHVSAADVLARVNRRSRRAHAHSLDDPAEAPGSSASSASSASSSASSSADGIGAIASVPEDLAAVAALGSEEASTGGDESVWEVGDAGEEEDVGPTSPRSSPSARSSHGVIAAGAGAGAGAGTPRGSPSGSPPLGRFPGRATGVGSPRQPSRSGSFLPSDGSGVAAGGPGSRRRARPSRSREGSLVHTNSHPDLGAAGSP